MAVADTANLIVKLTLGGNFTSQLASAQKGLGKFDAAVQRSSTRALKAGQQIGTGIKNSLKIAAVGVGLLASQVALGLNSLVKLETATTQTNAVLKSTKSVAGQTADSIRRLAERYEALNALVGDEVIQSTENLLLTFTNIRKKAFEPALKTILDVNTALGRGEGGLQSTATAVGKALNDPAKGLTALARLGIKFTEAQQKQIKAALKNNDTLKAQGIILAELNKRFGGSFIAQGGTTGAKVAKFTDSIEDLQRALANALLPTLGIVADKLTKFLADPKVVAGVTSLGQKIASLFNDKNLTDGANVLSGLFETAKRVAPTLQAAAEVTGRVVKEAVALFRSLPPELQGLLVSGAVLNKLTGGLVTNIAGGLISSVLKQLVSGVVNVSGGVVNVVGGPGIPGPGNGVPPVVGGGSTVGNALRTAVKVVIPVAAAAVIARAVTDAVDPGLNRAVDNGTALSQRDPRRVTGMGTRINVLPVTRAIQQAAKADSRQSLQNEQLLRRIQRSGHAGDLGIKNAVEKKDLSVRVVNNVNTTVKTLIDGRTVQANFDRYVSTVTGHAPGHGPLP